MNAIRRVVPAFALALVLAATAVGQPPMAQGDVVTSDGANVFRITPQGVMSTLVTNLPFPINALLPAPDNRGVIAIGSGIARIAADGTVTTLVSVNAGLNCALAEVDGDGNVLLGGLAGQALFFKVEPGGLVSTLMDARSSLFWGLVGGGLDPLTGDLIVAGRPLAPAPEGLYRVTAGASPQITAMCAVPIGGTLADGGAIHHDPVTGDLMFFSPGGVHRVSPTPPHAVTTVHPGPPVGQIPCLVEHDPARGDYVFGTAYGPLPNPQIPVGVLRFDATTRTFRTLIQNLFYPRGVTVAGIRHLCGLTGPTPGGRYTMLVSSPTEPGVAYVVALSAAPRPGIPLPGGRRIQLVPDALFFQSLTNAGIFRGFQGVLNGQGEAQATVNVPRIPGLRGFRFFASAVTLVQGRVSTIAETIGATIR
jgi:hypothetical protein